MILSRLKVRNVRSYTGATLRLEKGTTLLVGDVGSGKTSLLYAIEMALFGFSEVDPAYLVRHRARDAEVALGLSDGEHVYEFRRRFRRRFQRGKESFDIEENSFAVDGQRTRYSATELRQRSIDLLGFPDNPNPRAHSDVWRWAVYIPQERMRDVLLQSPTERIETARKALGIEQYRTAADNATDVAAELRRVAELHEAEAEQLRHWTDELPKWTAIRITRSRELEEQEAEERRRRTDRAAAQALLDTSEAERVERERDRKERERLQRSLTETESLRAAAERRRSERTRSREEIAESHRKALEEGSEWETRAGSVAPERDRLLALETELRASERTVRDHTAETTRRDAAQRSVAELERDRARLDGEVEETRRRLSEAESERPLKEPPEPTRRDLAAISLAIEERRRDLERTAGDLAAARQVDVELTELVTGGKCPRCGQTVDPAAHRPHIEEARGRLGEIEARSVAERAQLQDLEAERSARERYERAHERYVLVEERRRELRERVGALGIRAAEIAERLGGGRLAIAEAESALGILSPRLADRERIDRERAETAIRVRQAEVALAEAARCAELAKGLEARAAMIEEELVRLAEEGERLTARRDTERRELAGVDERLAGSGELERRLADARSRNELARAELERIIGRLERTRADLDEADRRITEADRGVRARNERLAESAHARALAGWMGREFRDGLIELEKRRLAQAQAEFNRAFSRYFQILIEDPNLVARCDLAFSPSVEIDGETTPPEALSGGERTALALAFRLAMGRVVREAGRLAIDTLILDEPTDGFSPEQVGRMSELLTELELGQIVIVSHEAGLSGIADHVIEVVKEGGRSVLRGTSVEPAPPEAPADDEGPIETPKPAARRRGARRVPIDEATAASDGTLPDPTADVPPPEGSRSGVPAASDRSAS